jgi:hypothetical protein
MNLPHLIAGEVEYSDIQPVNHYVRFVAAFEALVGVFYIAIAIARLVSGYRFGALPARNN